MGKVTAARFQRRFVIPVVAALALVVLATAAVAAGGQSAVFGSAGVVTYAGPSPTTTTSAEFHYGRGGAIQSVDVHTVDELVMGMLGSELTRCQDNHNSGACEDVEILLSDASVTSLHTSEAHLYRVTQSAMDVPGIGDVPVLHGLLRGELNGQFIITSAAGVGVGQANLRIGKGSTATYACFVPHPISGDPIPYTSFDPCVFNAPGSNFFPMILDVRDHGKFEIDGGAGLFDGVELEGQVMVNVQASPFGTNGTIQIPTAKASVND